MKQYTVTGMSCAACSARVEKAVSKVDGVTSCSVSPVSYTHLDVYKRQELSISFMFMRSENEFVLSDLSSDLLTESVWFTSVSYTHLNY